MKTRILNALKTEYAKLGLGEKAFDGVASFLAKTITKEEEIDGVIKSEDTRNLLKAFQGESDSLRNRNAQLQRDFDAYKQSHPDKDPEQDPGQKEDPDKPPKWFETYLESQKAEKRQGEFLASVRKRLEKNGCGNKGILDAVLKGFKAGENDTVDSLVETYKEEYDALYKETFNTTPAPLRGEDRGVAPDQSVIERRKAWVNKHLGVKEDEK